MFDGAYSDYQIDQSPDRPTQRDETPEEQHRRLIREQIEVLSNVPGKRGRFLRRALVSGWC